MCLSSIREEAEDSGFTANQRPPISAGDPNFAARKFGAKKKNKKEEEAKSSGPSPGQNPRPSGTERIVNRHLRVHPPRRDPPSSGKIRLTQPRKSGGRLGQC
ncbi:hypothetical protein NDU88_001327 [Pleurodeles waltl]|uniref:Uncharacterized protein n=1 Tax=Pleurodeles waltl TaxID=8319 RepID=A0AAV7THH6_PLEWA|nr:hypothetical protein NDU88_001327 [Pleurodeles waltl]